MTKNLLKQIMEKPAEQNKNFDTESIIKKIESGYLVDRVDKHQQKKTFAPSTLVFGHGECARYWYLAFEGGTFESKDTPYGVANMTSGTLSHSRIQKAMLDSGIAKAFIDEEETEKQGNTVYTTEFKVTNSKPPIFGWGDAIILWNDKEYIAEIKTMQNDMFEYFKGINKPKKGHLMQLLIYMKILGKGEGLMIYENKNNHELYIFPVEINEIYKQWINNTFEWLNTVKDAWKNKQLPKKTYRSNSKICKTCPLQKVCAVAEVGEIKIEPLEELSEVM